MTATTAKDRPLEEAQRLFDELAQDIQTSSDEFWWIEIGSTPLEICLHRDEVAESRDLFVQLLRDSDSRISAAPHVDDEDESEGANEPV